MHQMSSQSNNSFSPIFLASLSKMFPRAAEAVQASTSGRTGATAVSVAAPGATAVSVANAINEVAKLNSEVSSASDDFIVVKNKKQLKKEKQVILYY